LHSSPTRRSSDLVTQAAITQLVRDKLPVLDRQFGDQRKWRLREIAVKNLIRAFIEVWRREQRQRAGIEHGRLAAIDEDRIDGDQAVRQPHHERDEVIAAAAAALAAAASYAALAAATTAAAFRRLREEI